MGMKGDGVRICVKNLHTADGKGCVLLAERQAGVWRVTHLGSLSGLSPDPEVRVLDGEGGVVFPAFVDTFGYPDRQRTATGLREEALAAAKAGYGAILDADPPIGEAAEEAWRTRAAKGACAILPIAAISAEPGSAERAKARGAIAMSDGGRGIADHAALLSVMREAAALDMPLLLSPLCPDWQGVLRAGKAAQYYRVSGVPPLAQELAVARILLLARESGCRVHLPCVSEAGAIELIRRAKREGVAVTCGVTPFHIACTADDVFLRGTAAKICPPLGDRQAAEAILAGIADSTIDCIASGHVPIKRWEKQKPMETAAFGARGYEVAFAVCLTRLLGGGVVRASRLGELFSAVPAGIFGRDASLEVGAVADFVIADLRTEWVVGEDPTVGVGVSPFSGQTLRGRVIHSFISGQWY